MTSRFGREYGFQRVARCPSCDAEVITTRERVEPCRSCKAYAKVKRYVDLARRTADVALAERYHDLAQTQAVLATELREATRRYVDRMRALQARRRGAA